MECPLDLRSTLLNYILNALFRDTPLAYLSSRHVTYVTHVTRVTHMTHDTQVADRPNMCYIFENVMVQGPQNQCSQVSDVQIHKYKYTNTGLVKVADWLSMCYIFENVMVRGLQKECSQVSDVRIHKFKYTTSQIHKYIWFLV